MNGLFEGLAVSSARSLSKMSITSVSSDPEAASAKSVFVIGSSARADADASAAYEKGCRAFLTSRKAHLPKDAVILTASDAENAADEISKKLFTMPDARFIIMTAPKGITTVGLYLTDLLYRLGDEAAFIDTTGAVLTHGSTAFLEYSSAYDIRRYLFNLYSCGIRTFVTHAASPIALSSPDAEAVILNRDDCRIDSTVLMNNHPSTVLTVADESYTVPYPPTAAMNAAGAIKYARSHGYTYDEVRIAAEHAVSRGRLQIIDGTKVPCIIDSARTHDDLLFVIHEYRRCFDKITVVIGSVGKYHKERRREIADAINETAVRAILTADDPGIESAADIANEIAAMLDVNIERTVIPDRRAAIKYAIETAGESTCVLILGKGYENYQLIGRTKYPHDDADVAAHI